VHPTVAYQLVLASTNASYLAQKHQPKGYSLLQFAGLLDRSQSKGTNELACPSRAKTVDPNRLHTVTVMLCCLSSSVA
jgi:hypothetical protein